MTTATYGYPVVRATSVPGAGQKLRNPHFLIIVGVSLAVLVAAITLITVALKPTLQLCHFTCGPEVGPRLLAPTSFTSSEFGFRVEYDGNEFQVANHDQAGVSLVLSDQLGGGEEVITGVAGSDVNGALSTALGNINTNAVQDIQPLQAIPGAEIGEVEGIGEAYTGTLVPQNGGQSQAVTIAVEAATEHNVTISVYAIGPQDLSTVDDAPLGFEGGQAFDAPPTNTIWPG
jgi:hypothetical protein